jgi:mannose-6-phosphate isomerase-like protein (cupin superfamily)
LNTPAVADYTITRLEEVPDLSGDYPGEIQPFTKLIESEQVAFTHRHLPPDTGGIRGERIGHSHKTQEEIYYVIAGTMQLKLDDELIEIGPGTAVRIAPSTVRAVWNDGPDDVELLMFSTKVDDLRLEAEMHDDFWP